MLLIMQDGLMGNHWRIVGTEGSTSVEVAIPAREVAASDVQANAMPDLEDVAGGPQVDFVLVGLAWLDQRWHFSLREIAVARANDAVGQVLRETVGMDIDQPGHKIGIGCT